MATIEASGLRKTFGTTVALDGIDLRVEEGRILGLIGPNGAGKTTALNAILGLTSYEGELKVLGRDPWTVRDELMRDVSFIADVAVVPRWIRVSQMLDYVVGVHPRFDRAKAEGFLAKTSIKRTSKVRELSKGMVAQLHLALVMAIDAKLLVLDEPTLGLDILYRKQFYDSLLNDYFDRSRTVVVATHQVEEIQDVRKRQPITVLQSMRELLLDFGGCGRRVDFVGKDVVGVGFGDRPVQAGQQLEEGFAWAAHPHGQGLAFVVGDGRAPHRADLADGDLAMVNQFGDARPGQGRRVGGFPSGLLAYAAGCLAARALRAMFHGNNSSMWLMGWS